MTTPAPVRVALIGYGAAGERLHAPLIAATPGLDLALVVTANPQRRARVTSRYPQSLLLDSVEDLWERAGEVDLVVVATPNTWHAGLAIDALRLGVNVVIDKPMTVTTAEAQRVCSQAQRAGRMLSVSQNRRWDADLLTIRSLLESERLGPVARLESRYERFRPQVRTLAWREAPEPGGGLLYDLGSHLIDQVLLLFGRPTGVYAEVINRRPGAVVDDDTFVALYYPGGLVAHLWMSVTTPVPGPRFRVWGLASSYEKFGMDVQEAALILGAIPGGEGWGAEPETSWGVLTTALSAAGDTAHSRVPTVPGSYGTYYEGIREAIWHGTPPPVTGAEGQQVIEVIEAALESARLQSVVPLRAAS